jgi:hypothetical protein
MDKKPLIIGAASVAVVGILSYLGYRVMKELSSMVDDDIWKDFDDIYHHRYPKSKD